MMKSIQSITQKNINQQIQILHSSIEAKKNIQKLKKISHLKNFPLVFLIFDFSSGSSEILHHNVTNLKMKHNLGEKILLDEFSQLVIDALVLKLIGSSRLYHLFELSTGTKQH